MAYYECLNNNDHINIGDKFNVSLTGSHNQTITATVCYIDKTTLCLLSDTSLGTAIWSTQCKYSWNYTVNINNKNYTAICRIPTFEQLNSKCAGYKRDFYYWTSTPYDSNHSWYVNSNNGVYYDRSSSNTFETVPFIEIVL